MAFTIACKESGMDCDAVLRADTMEELEQKIAEHGKSVHNMDVATMPQSEKERLMSLVKEE